MTAALTPRQIKALAAVRTSLMEEAERLYELADFADRPPSDADMVVLNCVMRLRAAEAVLLRSIDVPAPTSEKPASAVLQPLRRRSR